MLAAALLAGAAALWRHLSTQPSSLQRDADRVSEVVASIRGIPFARSTPVKRISREEWREFVSREYRKWPVVEHYWAVVEKLGLYRGPDLGDPEKVYVDLLDLAGGAYDTESKSFLLLKDFDDATRHMVFAHELYHALQDQRFDLERYLPEMGGAPVANSDEVMARQSVVEGEASYIDALYQAKAAGSGKPTRELMAEYIAQQAEWDSEQWQQALEDPALDADIRKQLQEAIDLRERMPSFLYELFVSSYVDGMAFIHALQERGWPEVDKLYREYPPVSTEQILHPEKWLAREEPARIRWAPFDSDPLFADWQLLTENTLGERQLKIVFRQHGLESVAQSAAAGWNGDRYAVFKRRDSEAILLILFTTWDSTEDAAEFVASYRRVLDSKYSRGPVPARVRIVGKSVQIVEGAEERVIEDFVAFNAAATVVEGPNPAP